jgi:hypothetical protein
VDAGKEGETPLAICRLLRLWAGGPVAQDRPVSTRIVARASGQKGRVGRKHYRQTRKGRAQVIEAEGHGPERISQISCMAIFVLLLFLDGYSKGGHPISSPEEVFLLWQGALFVCGFCCASG